MQKSNASALLKYREDISTRNEELEITGKPFNKSIFIRFFFFLFFYCGDREMNHTIDLLFSFDERRFAIFS